MLIIVCRTLAGGLLLYSSMKKPKSDILKIIAQNVRYSRHCHGMSQEELAEVAGVHRTYIGMIERSEKNVTVLSLDKIASALDVPVETLLQEK